MLLKYIAFNNNDKGEKMRTTTEIIHKAIEIYEKLFCYCVLWKYQLVRLNLF